jgi:hypothetical protein
MPGNVDDSGYEVLSPRAEQDLYEARGTPDSEPANIPLPSMSPAPMGLQVPPGYVKYDPLDANHSNHVKTIRLDAYMTLCQPPLHKVRLQLWVQPALRPGASG